jgi:signal transduction histidine kinase
LVGTAAIVALVLVATILAHRFVQPIRRLGDRAAAIAEGNFEPLPVTRRNDEIRDLTLSINRMAEQLDGYENEVRRHEQLRTLGQLGAGLAHQLRNAATGGRMAIELHQMHCRSKEDEENRETLEIALRQLRLMESYLQRFLALGQTHDAPHEPLDLEALVTDALDLTRSSAVHAGIDLVYNGKVFCRPTGEATGEETELRGNDNLVISGDADALRQLFVNLLLNAIDAVRGGEGETKRIEVEIQLADAWTATVKIADNGPGPDAKVADHLFEPFVTGKPEGTGLGLYVARQTVEAHQGKIAWKRLHDKTVFEVELPIARVRESRAGQA